MSTISMTPIDPAIEPVPIDPAPIDSGPDPAWIAQAEDEERRLDFYGLSHDADDLADAADG